MPPSATRTSFVIGTWNPLTDAFTSVLDLNDGTTFAIHNKGLQLTQPDKSIIESGNLRTAGVIVPRWQYKARHIVVEVWLRGATTSALLASIRALLTAIETPPYSIRLAPPGASQYSYADVVAVKHDIPSDPQVILAGAITRIHIDFECRVGLRGDRVILSNLVPNPGAEQPSGSGVVVFSDTFASVNAYALTNPGYSATVLADNPRRYYRFNETSGTNAVDAGVAPVNGTYAGATLGQVGILGVGNNAAASFSGAATSNMTAAGTGLPSGNGAWALEAWVYITANPAANAQIVSIGTAGTNTAAMLSIASNGKPFLNFQGGTSVNAASAISLNAWHHIVGTWDGTTLTLYVDGAASGTPITPGAGNLGTTGLSVASNLSDNGSWLAGTVDEVAVYNFAVNAAHVLSHYQAGAPTAPAATANATYVDTVEADLPLRYYRMAEASGTAAIDVSGNGQNGTYQAAPTLGSASAISGDSGDTSVTFNGSTQYMSVPVSGFPTGNPAMSLECWVYLTANPATTVNVISYGTQATSERLALFLNSSGQAAADTYNGATGLSAALTLNTWHHLVATWDGTNLKCYVDGANTASATPGNMTIPASGNAAAVAADTTGNRPFAGRVDEAAFYTGALSAARVTAHYNGGHAGTGMGTVSNSMVLPAGSRVSFGSPAWSAFNTWQIRFRYATGGTYRFYLHYIDVNNWLRVVVNSGNQAKIEHNVAGTTTTVASASITPLVSNVWYWFQVTQFPGQNNNPPWVIAYLSNDNEGNPLGPTLTTLSGATASASVALSGQPQVEASGAALVLGGNYSNVNMLSLFGPGGWTFEPNAASATGLASGAWEQNTANTYPNGPVTSFGALRIDLPPGGLVDADWRTYSGGAPTGVLGALPVRQAGDTLAGSIWVTQTGLSANATVNLQLKQFDASGSLLATVTLQTVNRGNIASYPGWTQLSGTTVAVANAAWFTLMLRVTDTSAAGASAGATVWADNAQAWNQTATGMATMPWCALRGVRSPASLVVSGILGDMPAPAQLALGTYLFSWPTSGTITLYAGRKQTTTPNAQFVASSFGPYSGSFSPLATPSLDSGSWSGYFISATVSTGGWNPRFAWPTTADAKGVYHLLARVRTAQSSGNLPNISLRVATVQQNDPGLNLSSAADVVGQWSGAYVYPFVASNTWQVVDAGQCNLPPFAQGALTDPGKLYLTPRAQWQDTSGGGGAAGNADWQALLPIDGSLLMATLNNPSNSAGAVATSWLWTYADPLLTNRGANGDGAAWTLSVESIPTPNPAAGAGGAGNQSSGALNVNSAADPFLTLDPAQEGTAGAAGVNQIVAVLADQAGSVYPVFTELTYSPLYLYPR